MSPLLSRVTRACLLLVCTLGLSSKVEGAASIIRVERHLAVDQVSQDGRRSAHKRMPKFTEALRAKNAKYLLYFVDWLPPSEGLPANTMLFFDYRQEAVDGVRTLKIKYPFAIKDQRRATFEIGRKAYRLGGEVTAWQVRLMEKNRLIASEASATWR